MQLVHLQEITITERAVNAGGAFTSRYDVSLDGRPFGIICRFTAEQGGNWYVGLADSTVGGRFDTYVDAETFIRSQM